jgi:serine/threonine protein kinase
MGRVYKALHRNMNRTVALKVLAPHLVRTPKAQVLFQREVQAAAQLNHPNIVTAYDANEVRGRHYLAMEFVDGPNLEQLVRDQGPLPVGMACEIIRQVASGLQHAHEHHMVHQDIKPANVLLQPSGNLQSFVVKILDFGLARLNDPEAEEIPSATTRENIVMGTPDFLSPEQGRNLQQIDIRSDLYSVGCTLYFLLTGKVPYPGGTSLEKLSRHGSEEPRSIGEYRQDMPAPVEAILKRLLAKKPEDRYQVPEALAADLALYAVPCAPTWNREAGRAPVVFNSNTPTPKSGDTGAKSGNADMIGTLPSAQSPTPHSGFLESQFLLETDFDHGYRRELRTAILWSSGTLIALAAILVFTFFILNQ